VRIHGWVQEVVTSVRPPSAIVVNPAQVFVLAAEAVGYPVGLRAVTHPGSHFSLNMLTNLRNMTRILTALGKEYAWGKTMQSAKLFLVVGMSTPP
jgi:hypothetical protein